MKKLTLLFLLALLLPLTASALVVDKVYYSLDNSNNTAEVVSCDDELGSVTIPATVTDDEGYTYTVTGIADNAFSEHYYIRGVELPNTIISIGKSAFYKMRVLTSINIPNSVKSIGEKAFMDCGKLSTVSVGRNSTLTSIGSNAFNGCSSLRSFNMPNSVENIGARAFYYCSTISSINIPTSLTRIEERTFAGTAIQTATIPSSVTSIGNYAFYNCSGLTSVSIPNSVTSIGNNAFEDCSGLTSVTIPNSVTSIEYNTFYGCSALASVTIGDGVTSIGKSAFEKCTSLASLTIGSSVASIGEKAFYGCSALNSLTIPNSVETLGESAFEGCSGLASVTIPKSVTTIGKYVFSGCTGELTVNCNIPSVYSSYSNGKFYGSKFSSVIIGDDVETIGNNAFYWCSSITSVTIGNSVKTIGEDAFRFCSGITSLTIPNSVTSIGSGAFYGCSGLTSVTIPKSVTSIGSSAFYDCTGELTVNCNIPNKTSSLFNNSKFSSVKIGDDVETVGDYAFYYCSSLTSVTIGNSVKTIGKDAFYYCSSLTSLTIGNNVTSIGEYAFCGCDGLTSVTIPNSVITIAGSAFYGCDGLTSLTIGNSVTSIGDYAFYKCPKLTSVIIPNSVKSIGKYAFEDCSGLTSVTIGKSVTTIGSMAFYKCSALTEIYNYATTPQNITSYDFSNYSATLHVVPGYGAAYRAANVWKDFQTIVEDATDGEPIEKPKLSLSASPSGGDVAAGTKVYLTAKANSSTVSGANIYYTLNGTTPSKNSTAYTSSGITINTSCTLKAIAYKDGYEDSDVLTTAYNTVTITGITINETNFPDANFRKYLLEQDYGSDGVLTETEIAEITYMDVSGAGIENLKGIGYFKGLEYLGCTDNKLTSLDVSGCSNLRMLYCSINKLTSLNVSGCSMLNWLYCNDNQLTSLDMSGCPELYLLYVYQNKIKDAAMDAFIKSLPTVSNGEMAIIFDYNEGNVMTTAQVAAAKAKGWTPYYSNDPDMTDWQEYAGEGSELEPVYMETDVTANFPTNWQGWVGATGYTSTQYAPMVTTNDGRRVQVCERYEVYAGIGTVFYRTLTGLTNGTYRIELYGAASSTKGRDTYVSSDMTAYDEGDETAVYLYATTPSGTVKQYIPVHWATSFSEVATAVLNNVEVTDGTVEIGMYSEKNYTNWHVVQIKGVTALVDIAERYSDVLQTAKAVLSDSIAYTNVVGEERTTLVQAVRQYSTISEKTAEAYQTAINAIVTATVTFTDAKASYDEWAHIKNMSYSYASAEKKSAAEAAAAAAANPTNAADAVIKTEYMIPFFRSYAESSALLEGVKGSENVTDTYILNPRAEEDYSSTGWQVHWGTNSPIGDITIRTDQPWTDASGNSNHRYFDGGHWGAQSWVATQAQDITLPAGHYQLTVLGRSSQDVEQTLFAGDNAVEMPHKGDNGGLFNLGWEQTSVEFELTEESIVSIGVMGVSSGIHNWMSFSDFRLVRFPDTEPVLRGDANGDGEVNVGDLVSVSNYMAGDGSVSKEAADVNEDGEVNVGDMVVISNIMSGHE